MTKKQVVRCIAFLMLAFSMLLILCDLFEQENTSNGDQRYAQYRQLQENTIDALFVGTSGVDRYWIGPKAYDEYGMTVYPIAFDACPGWLMPYALEDALRYQDPELILLDIRPYTQSSDAENMDVIARRMLDAMDFYSPVRFKAACRTVELIHKVDPERSRWDLSFHFPVIKYHAKWNEDYWFQTNMGDRTHKFLGFYMNAPLTVGVEEQIPQKYDAREISPLDPVSERALYDTLAFIRERELNVLFVDTPKFFENEELGRTNRIMEILEEEGFSCVSFYTEDSDSGFAIDLDPKKDFYNLGHVNYYGAEKFTSAMAAYLHENYDLPDRRGDAAVQEEWDGIYEKIQKTVQKYEKQKKESELQALEDVLKAVDLQDPAITEALQTALERAEPAE